MLSCEGSRTKGVKEAIIFAILVNLSILFGLPAFSADYLWTASGPEGGTVSRVAISPSDPGVVFAGTHGGGVFKSTDGGTAWHPANSGLGGSEIRAIAVHPTDPNRIFVGSWAGLFRSDDGGGSWEFVDTGQWFIDVSVVVFSVSNPDVMYLAVGGSSLRKSTNGGIHWNPVWIWPPADITTIAVDPTNPDIAYFGSWGSGAFKTTDGGDTWKKLALSDLDIITIAIDPEDPTTLFVSSDMLWKSTDGGESWDISSWAVHDIAFDPYDSQIVYTAGTPGVRKSLNSGRTWDQAGTGLESEYVNEIAIDPFHPSKVIACTIANGVFLSNDGGQVWNQANKGLVATEISALALDPRSPDTVYAGTFYQGLFKSSDGGSSWQDIGTGLEPGSIMAVVVNPAFPSTIFLATMFNGLYKSTDSGATWRHLDLVDGIISCGGFIIDPSEPDRLYVCLGQAGLYRTKDGGLTWSPLNLGQMGITVNAIAIDPIETGTLYAGTSGNGAFRSCDGGETWHPINEGLATHMGISQIVVSPADHATVYLAGSNTYYKSENGGDTWTFLGYNVVETSFLPDPLVADAVYCGSGGSWGPMKSTDGGINWRPLNRGIENCHIRSLALHPSNPERLYAGASGGGVFTMDTPPTNCLLTCSATAGPVGGAMPLAVSFSAEDVATDCISGAAFTWLFGDGRSSSEKSPVHTYWMERSFTWTLFVSADGQTCTCSGEIIVGKSCDLSCQASATPTSGISPLGVTFTAKMLPANCWGEQSFAWDFGDGGISNLQNPHHTYARAGKYFWYMTAGFGGTTCTAGDLITVSPSLPGDCDGDGAVFIGELQKAINMFLGALAPDCGVDCDGNGAISIGELQKVINAFLGLPASCLQTSLGSRPDCRTGKNTSPARMFLRAWCG